MTILVSQARSGNKEAFCELYGLFKDRLYRYALYRLSSHEQAEDAVSECVLAAWKDLCKLRSDNAFSTWIFRILHNICAGMVKEQIRQRDHFGPALTGDGTYDPDDVIAARADDENLTPVSTSIELAEALGQLADEEREIVLLSIVSGLTSREISDIMGLAPGSVRSKLSRSLAKMRSFLA